MSVQLRFNAKKAMAKLDVFTQSQTERFGAAVQKAVTETSTEIKRRGDANIRRSGNFGKRWTNAFEANPVHEEDKSSIEVGFSEEIPYAHIHEFGGTIRGRPLLWIPLSWANEAQDVSARDYPGQLFRVERKGKNPLLFSAKDQEAKYVGVTHVTLRPRFGLRQITANVARAELARAFFDYIKKAV